MVAKLSSVRIMTAAFLDTSVPVMPMATPMSAALRAGASLTPSPVMAATLPLCLSSRTSRSLSSGATRATTPISGSWVSNSSSLMAANSAPVMARPSMPSSVAMAAAVVAWSPVIMRTRMPASRHSAIAALASARGGSTIPAMASRVRSVTRPSRSPAGSKLAGSRSRWATTITRSPEAAMRSLASRASERLPSVIGTRAPVEPALGREHDQGALGRIPDQALAVQHRVRAQGHRQQVRVQVDVRPADVLDLTVGRVALARDGEPVLARDGQLPGGHLVQGEGAGLVRADHRGRAEGLDRRQALDDGVAAGDLAGPDRQQRSDYGREPGRDRRHGQRHPGDEQRVKRLPADQPERDDQQQRHAGDGGDDLGQAVELLLQGRLVGLGGGQEIRDVADLGAHAGGGDDHLTPAAGDRGIHEGHTGPVPQGHLIPW